VVVNAENAANGFGITEGTATSCSTPAPTA
jgi:calcineurin-like phosphoesterase